MNSRTVMVFFHVFKCKTGWTFSRNIGHLHVLLHGFKPDPRKRAKTAERWLNVAMMRQELNLGRKVIKAECEQLCSLGSLKREIRVDRIGGHIGSDESGHEYEKGGLIQEVEYYAPVSQKKL